MFVSSSKYEKVLIRNVQLELELFIEKHRAYCLLDKCRNLTDSDKFTQEDVSKLLILCHPDKNNQSKISVEMTQKILKLKG